MSVSYKKVIMTGLVGGFLGGAVKMGWEALLPPRTPERDEEPPPMTMLHQLDLTAQDIGSVKLKNTLSNVNISTLVSQLNIGEPTLKDIIQSLIAPNRDPRDEFETPILKSDVLSIEDLSKGMKLNGTVRNVVDFGAFVDIGVKQDGLVHISKLSKKFVKNPMDMISVGDIVEVWILDIDENKGKVSLTMVDPNE